MIFRTRRKQRVAKIQVFAEFPNAASPKKQAFSEKILTEKVVCELRQFRLEHLYGFRCFCSIFVCVPLFVLCSIMPLKIALLCAMRTCASEGEHFNDSRLYLYYFNCQESVYGNEQTSIGWAEQTAQ
jgi:hypothetical protein